MFKRSLSLVLAVAMIFSTMPIGVFADDIVDSGKDSGASANATVVENNVSDSGNAKEDSRLIFDETKGNVKFDDDELVIEPRAGFKVSSVKVSGSKKTEKVQLSDYADTVNCLPITEIAADLGIQYVKKVQVNFEVSDEVVFWYELPEADEDGICEEKLGTAKLSSDIVSFIEELNAECVETNEGEVDFLARAMGIEVTNFSATNFAKQNEVDDINEYFWESIEWNAEDGNWVAYADITTLASGEKAASYLYGYATIVITGDGIVKVGGKKSGWTDLSSGDGVWINDKSIGIEKDELANLQKIIVTYFDGPTKTFDENGNNNLNNLFTGNKPRCLDYGKITKNIDAISQIEFVFAKKQPEKFAITTDTENCRIDVVSEAEENAEVTFTVNPNNGCKVKSVFVNGETVKLDNNNSATFTIEKDTTIKAVCEQYYTVSTDAAEGTEITVDVTEVKAGADVTFMAKATNEEDYYDFGFTVVDDNGNKVEYKTNFKIGKHGKPTEKIESYTVENVDSNITIKTTNKAYLTVEKEATNCEIEIEGATKVKAGANVTFKVIYDNDKFQAPVVTVNGAEVQLDNGEYTVKDIAENITIKAVCEEIPTFTVTYEAVNCEITDVDDSEKSGLKSGDVITFKVNADTTKGTLAVTANDETLIDVNGVYTYTVTADTTVKAVYTAFTKEQYKEKFLKEFKLSDKAVLYAVNSATDKYIEQEIAANQYGKASSQPDANYKAIASAKVDTKATLDKLFEKLWEKYGNYDKIVAAMKAGSIGFPGEHGTLVYGNVELYENYKHINLDEATVYVVKSYGKEWHLDCQVPLYYDVTVEAVQCTVSGIENGAKVKLGETIKFDVNYDANEYKLVSVKVNGQSVTSYTVEVNGNVKIEAVCEPIPTYTVNYSGENCTVTANVENGATVKEGTEVIFKVEYDADNCYAPVAKLNGSEFTLNADGTYTVKVTENANFTAECKAIPVYTVSVLEKVNCEVELSATEVKEGNEISFSVTPDENCRVKGVYVNGEDVTDKLTATFGRSTSYIYTVSNVKGAVEIKAICEKAPIVKIVDITGYGHVTDGETVLDYNVLGSDYIVSEDAYSVNLKVEGWNGTTLQKITVKQGDTETVYTAWGRPNALKDVVSGKVFSLNDLAADTTYELSFEFNTKTLWVKYFLTNDGKERAETTGKNVVGYPQADYTQYGSGRMNEALTKYIFENNLKTVVVADVADANFSYDAAAQETYGNLYAQNPNWYVVKNVNGSWHVDGTLNLPVEYTVFVNGEAAGENFPADRIPENTTVAYGQKFEVPAYNTESFTDENGKFIFDVANSGNADGIVIEKATDKISVTYSWNYYTNPTVTYVVNGNAPEGQLPAQATVNYGEGYTVDTTYGAETVRGENGLWSFNGWDTEDMTEVTTDTTITGTWTFNADPTVTYTVTVNGETAGENFSRIPANTTALYGQKFELPQYDTNSFTDENGKYIYQGMGVVVNNEYVDGTVIENATENIAVTYAWNYYTNPTVTYVVNGDVPAGVVIPAQATVNYGEGYTADTTYGATVETEEGTWTFSGWDTEVLAAVTADTTITGTWTFTAKNTEEENTTPGGGSGNGGGAGGSEEEPATPVVPETPETPVAPETPVTPSTPGTSSGGGDDEDTGNGDNDEPATPYNPVVTIEDEAVPLASSGDSAAAPANLVTILDEEVPLARLPKSGGNSAFALAAFAASSIISAAAVFFKKK